jgi:hypothetical protein
MARRARMYVLDGSARLYVLDGSARLYVLDAARVCISVRDARMCVIELCADTRKISDRRCVRTTQFYLCWTPRAYVCVARRSRMYLLDASCVCTCVRASRMYVLDGRARMYKCALRSHMFVLHTAHVSMSVHALRVCIFWTTLVYVRVCALRVWV